MAQADNNSSTRTASYEGNPAGSTWNKWDLHVHTPASVVHNYGAGDEKQTWEKFITALEMLSAEIRVLGINDYFILDGYKRLIAEKQDGRLQNIELLLPVIELRLSNFAGHSDLRKVNYHIIFSDELTPDQIENFLLRKLMVNLKLDDGTEWQGSVAHLDGLIEFGKAIRRTTHSEKIANVTDLELGFANVAIPFESIQEALKESVLDNKYLCAVGLSEWDQMRWDGGSGAIKKDIIYKSDMLLTCSPSPKKYSEQVDKLIEQGVTHKLLDCSDAHHYSDVSQPNKLGNVFTWLKADLTFRGLHRTLQCFDKRVQVIGLEDSPSKLVRVNNSPGRYIRSIEIRKVRGSKVDEKWFDCSIPINHDLVAIIGNQGNGKSALTDIIALCGNAKNKDFSFLTADKFRDRDNKAGSFQATLTWNDDSSSTKKLDEDIDVTEFERVKYVPQGFFEAVTNETDVGERGLFYKEIKKAIYSHIPDSKRLDLPDLDALIDFHTDQMESSLEFIRGELKDINSRIVTLENECSKSEILRLENAIKVKNGEIASLKKKEPTKIEEPQESVEANKEIEELRRQETRIQEQIDLANKNLIGTNKNSAYLTQMAQSIEKQKTGI